MFKFVLKKIEKTNFHYFLMYAECLFFLKKYFAHYKVLTFKKLLIYKSCLLFGAHSLFHICYRRHQHFIFRILQVYLKNQK